MASKQVKSNKMKRMVSKKSHSWWWDNHIRPESSEWLQDNVQAMRQKVKLMLKVIEEDVDSFSERAEMYFQKRPKLINLVQEFYQMYRALGERHDLVTELRKNFQSHGFPDRKQSGPALGGSGLDLKKGTDPSEWLKHNLEEMDQKVKLMLKLIQEDADLDSVTKRVDMYFEKRPELINLVDEFSRMYQALAERYDLVIGELRNNVESLGLDLSTGDNPSKWLQHNLEEMDQKVKLMLKLIEEDADSFARRAEMYYKRRPELVNLIEECYRLYRALAERHDHVTGEIGRRIQSQGPGFSGFSGLKKGHNSSSSSDSEPERVDDEHELRQRITELEAELSDVKEKLESQQREISEGLPMKPKNENSELLTKIAASEEDLRIAEEKIRSFEEENSLLLTELQKYKSLEEGEANQNLIRGIQPKPELKITQEKLNESEKEIASVRDELERKGSSIQQLEHQLESARNEILKLENQKTEVSNLRYQVEIDKSNLADRDQEISNRAAES